MDNKELRPSAFVSNPEVLISSLSISSPPFPPLWVKSQTSPNVRFGVNKPGRTLIRPKLNTLTIAALPRDTRIGTWRLNSVLLVQIRRTRKGFLATTWLEGVEEYGVAEGETEAIADLVVSLGEYREALERRQAKLGDSGRGELNYLCKLIERVGE